MIGQLVELTSDLLWDFLSTYFLQWMIGLIISGGSGWLLGQRLAQHIAVESGHNGWLMRFPGQPILMLLIIILPFLGLPWLVNLVVIAILLIPSVLLVSVRYHNVYHSDALQQTIDRRALLYSSWADVAFLSAGFLISGLFFLALIPAASESVTDHLSNLPLALMMAIVVGAMLGFGLGVLRNRLADHIETRYARNEYGLNLVILEKLRSGIELLPTQFHGTPLTGVLIICAVALPFSRLAQTRSLALILLLPVVSAMLNACLVTDPQPDQPDRWHHWRLGLTNVMQVCVGYMVGAAMLIPLHLQHVWMLEESDEVLKQLNTHLELTFLALGISILLGVGGGIVSSRLEILRTVLINLGNVGRTIPSLAVLALALPIFGVGRDPSLVALIFIGVLPILVNTSVGILSVSREIKEAARGMGMNDFQVLFGVEVPIAIPVIMAGVRTSAVLVVASATLAGFIGGGGLGALIIRGDGSGRNDILITGAVLATILSVFWEYFFGWLETLLTPRGLRET